jgi:peptide/nickel transport system substrate-binding protein
LPRRYRPGHLPGLGGLRRAGKPRPAGRRRPQRLRARRQPGPRGSEWKRAFNPFRDDTDTRWPASAGVYEPLLVYSRATRTYLPWLATAHTWGAGNLTLLFTIRPGVLWSDGAPFSSRDVVFTFDLLRRFPALDRQGMWAFLTDVKAVPSGVEFTFKRAYTPGFVSIATQPIVAEHRWKEVAQPGSFDDPSPVGTGPFTEVKRFEPTVYELGKNPRYWQPGKPTVDVLRVPLYRSNDELLRAMEGGELDWASLFLSDVEKRWVAKDPARHLYWYPDLGPMVLLQLNTEHKPFDDADGAQGPQPGAGSPAGPARGAQRLRAARGRERPGRVPEGVEGRGPGAGRPLDHARRGPGQQAAGRRRSGSRRRRHSGGARRGRHAL